VKGVVGVALGALLAALAVSCAAGAMQSKAGGAAPRAVDGGTMPVMSVSEAHAQIERLDRQITDSMARGHVPAASVEAIEPTASPQERIAATPMAAPPRLDLECHHGASEACTDSCTLADSICEDAQKICNLAKQLPGDEYAADKCTSGEASCRAAKDRCCACQ
jgi:hypothetical protein